MDSVRRLPTTSPVLLAAGLGIVALVVRLAFLGTIPHGLHHDEAWNGLDELTISWSYHPIFFPNSNGREPLFLYLQAVSMAIFGPTPSALRGTSAVAGAITVVLAFWMARTVTRSTAVGGVAGFLCAFSFWHLLDSRLGYRAILQPAFETASLLVFWIAWHGEESTPSARNARRLALVMLGGALTGACIYTYIAVRVFPLVLVAWFAWRTIASERSRRWAEVREWCLAGTTAVVVAAPLAWYFLRHPNEFLGRASQVAAFAPLDNGPLDTGGAAASILRTLGMFSFRGDELWKFNIGGKPVFDWPISILFYAGLALCLPAIVRAVRRSTIDDASLSAPLSGEAAWLVFIWIAVMLVPGFLSTESPYYYRVIGVLPAIFIPPALSLVSLCLWIKKRYLRWSKLAHAAAALLLLAEAVITCRDYFVVWGPSWPAYDSLHGEAADLARGLQSVPAGSPAVISTDYYEHPTIRFLAPTHVSGATWIRGTEVFVVSPGVGPAIYALQGGVEPTFLDLNAVFRGQQPVAVGSDPAHGEAFRIYRSRSSDIMLPVPQHALNQTLGNLVQIHGYSVVPQSYSQPDSIGILLFWKALSPSQRKISIYTHVEDSSGHLWAQQDNLGYFSADWQPGAEVVSYHQIRVPAGTPPVEMRLRSGFYHLDDLSPLVPIGQASGNAGLDLGTVTVAAVKTTAKPSPTIGQLLAPGLSLQGSSPLPKEVRQGADLEVTLYARVQVPLAGGQSIRLSLVDRTGQAIPATDTVPLAAAYPPEHWMVGVVAEAHVLHLGPRAAGGPASLTAQLVDREGKTIAGQKPATLGTIAVTELPRSFVSPTVPTPLNVTLSSAFELAGYALLSPTLSPGGAVNVTLFWRDIRPSDVRYTVFMHLVDATGVLRGQRDGQPSEGVWPTTSWVPGQYVTDDYTIPVDQAAPKGAYHLELGMYDATTGSRLPIVGPQGQASGDHIVIDGLTL